MPSRNRNGRRERIGPLREEEDVFGAVVQRGKALGEGLDVCLGLVRAGQHAPVAHVHEPGEVRHLVDELERRAVRDDDDAPALRVAHVADKRRAAFDRGVRARQRVGRAAVQQLAADERDRRVRAERQRVPVGDEAAPRDEFRRAHRPDVVDGDGRLGGDRGEARERRQRGRRLRPVARDDRAPFKVDFGEARAEARPFRAEGSPALHHKRERLRVDRVVHVVRREGGPVHDDPPRHVREAAPKAEAMLVLRTARAARAERVPGPQQRERVRVALRVDPPVRQVADVARGRAGDRRVRAVEPELDAYHDLEGALGAPDQQRARQLPSVHRHGRRRAARPRKVELAPLEEAGGRVPRVVDVERRAGAHGDIAALEERTGRPPLEDALDDAEVHRQRLVGVRSDKATRPRLDERVARLQRKVRRLQRLLKAAGGPFLDHDGLLRAAHRRRDRQRQHPDCFPHLVLPVFAHATTQAPYTGTVHRHRHRHRTMTIRHNAKQGYAILYPP